MKWTTLLLVIAVVHTRSSAYGQITLQERNVPLEKVLTNIEKQTKYVFLYDPDDLKMATIIISVKNATLQETLEKIFRDKPIEFTIVGKNVLLKKKSPQNPKTDLNADISGRVTDENGQPLANVTVLNKRATRATETDSTGLFTIGATKDDILRVSFVGLKEKEVRIGEQHHIDIALEVNPASPEEVVVIGYGSSKMKDLTGSVSIVSMKSTDEIPFNTIDNALAGKAAGLEVTKTDGTPGGMVRMRIRGTSSLLGGNDPLYVIDGIPVQVRSNFIYPGYAVASPAPDLAGAFREVNGATLSGLFVNGLNSLGGLNPGDIESVTILKDASATAIYGSKAANGVIIITTKTGIANSRPQVTLDHYNTVTSLYNSPKLLNASQYKTLLTESARSAFDENAAQGFLPDPVTAAILDSPTYFGTANTDWIRKVIRTTVSDHIGLSVSGGGPTSKYFTSLAYNNTPGVVIGTDFRRISGKINLETEIGSKFRFVTNLLWGFTDQDISAGAYAQALFARPDWAPRDIKGNFTDFAPQNFYQDFLNPAALLTSTNNGKTTSLLGSVSGIYTISKDLRFRSTVSLNRQNYNQRNFLPDYIDIIGYNGNTANPGGTGSNANSRFADWFLENTLTYNKRLNKHTFNAVIGQSYETTKYSYFRATASGYPNNTTLTGLSSATTPLSVAGDDPGSPQSYLVSFYARANYGYLDKYLLTFTGRTDGSSKFGPDNKYGYFPSGALAWRISRENFLKNIGWITDLKLRGSYGLTGNQNIGDQIYRTLYSPATYNGNSALIPTQLGNQGIKWESTKEADIGLDLSLLTGRLNVTFDYYNKQTNGGLFSLPVAASSSFPSLLENAVGLRNRGFEVSVGSDIIRARDFSWTASLYVSRNRSLVTRLDPLADASQIVSPSGFESVSNSMKVFTGNTGLVQGESLGLITGSYITGIIKTQAQLDAYSSQLGTSASRYALQIGAPMYRLGIIAATQKYAPLDGQVIGNGSPKYSGGTTHEISYKRFSLQFHFTFSHGGELLWVEHIATDQFFGTANANRLMLNRYAPLNPNSHAQVLSLNYFNNETNLDVFSSSYFKLRSLTFNYRFNVKKTFISNAQVFVSATNVFTITKYPGSDPETSDDPYSPGGGYMDAGNYPATRTFSLGLKAGF